MGRRELNTGAVGVSGSGDTVNAGGVKIASNTGELYNAFGDQSLDGQIKTPATGEEYIVPHAASYYQREELSFYSNPVQTGSRHDIDITDATDDVIITLPTIIDTYSGAAGTGIWARRGDRIELLDTSRTWGVEHNVIIRAASGQNIAGVSGGSLTVNEAYRRVLFYVTNDSSGNQSWDYQFTPIDGVAGGAIVDETVSIAASGTERVTLTSIEAYDALKLTVYAEEYSATEEAAVNWSSSEVLLLNTQTDATITRYSIIESSDIISLEPSVVSNNLVIDVTAKPTRNTVRCSIASIEGVKNRTLERTIVRKRLQARWSTGGPVSNDIQFQWETRKFIELDKVIQWNTRSFIDDDLVIQWNIS